jgi:HPt (histidine-containing phosphotransfer) domain-containing protein
VPFAGDESAPLDEEVLDNLRAASGDDDEFLRELAAIYLEDTPPRLEEIRLAARDGDASKLARAAHALRSGSGNLGATEVWRLCGELEKAGGSGTLAGVETTIRELDRQYARVETALQKLIEG